MSIGKRNSFWKLSGVEDTSVPGVFTVYNCVNCFRQGPLLPIFIFLAVGLTTLSLLSFTRFAYGNANLNMNLNITAGSMSVSASTTESFSNAPYSFSNQTTTSPNVESINIQDARGGAGSWTFNVSCNDNSSGGCTWNGTTEKQRFGLTNDMGTAVADPASSSGKMCIDMTAGGGYRCLSKSGAGCGAVTLTTAYRCFVNKTTDITAATGSSANGDYYLAEWDWAQGVPGLATAVAYTTVITYDLQ